KFYGQTEEVLFTAIRPILLNGITVDNADRADLRQRALMVELPQIPTDRRKTDGEVEQQLAVIQPEILGALLHAGVTGLSRQCIALPKNLPRMADTACWIEACAPALGWGPGEFLTAYEEMQKTSDLENGANWAVLPAIQKLLTRADKGVWSGTMSELLAKLV